MGKRGIIFDFDNTITNTNSTKANRRSGRWKEVIIGINNYRVDPCITHLFDTLKNEGIQICVVSNSPEDYCRAAMNHLGLKTDYIVGYHDTPFVHKPDPEPIELALCLMGHPEDVIGIGDEESDVIAYNRAGIRAINYQEYSGYYASENVITNCVTADELEAVIFNCFGIKTPVVSKKRISEAQGSETSKETEGTAEIKQENAFLEESKRLDAIENKIASEITSLEAQAIKYEKQMQNIMGIDYDAVDEKKYLADKKTRLFKKASEYERCKGTPYFGRMVVDEKDLASGRSNKNTSYLIGKNEISTNADGILVHDWRTPVGEYFYQKNELDFRVNNYHYILNLRRALQIENAVLIGCKTEYERTSGHKTVKNLKTSEELNPEEKQEQKTNKGTVITDPFLQQVIRDKRRENRTTDIISTIQEKQNEIIRSDVNKSFIVQGCAGSGKTMILLHRLSYLLFNNKITTDKTVIITPNNHFVTVINDLCKELGIDKIKKLSIRKYYMRLINQYTSKSTKGWSISRESSLDKHLLSEIYSHDFLSLVNSKFDEYWDICVKMLEDNNYTYLFNKFTTEDYQLKTDDSHLWEGKRYSEKDIDITIKSKHSYSMLDNTIKQIQNDITRLQNEYSENSQRVREIEIQLKDIKWKLNHQDNMQRGSLLERANALVRRKEQLLSKINEINILVPSEEEEKALDNCQRAIDKLAFDNVSDTLMKELLTAVYTRHGTELTSKVYQHKLYLELILCYRYFGELSKPDLFINIDEAQDLSVCEYRLLKNVLGKNAVFNLYGDIWQLIYEFKDIYDWKQLEDIISDKRYDLSENYRNTLQITEYCNALFKRYLYPIGITGADVIELNLLDTFEMIRYLRYKHPKYRVAIITKDRSNKFRLKLDKVFDIDEYSWMKIEDEKVPVISVEMAKGLEFDAVAVIAKDMTEKEKYISFTRAMDNLIINNPK